MTVEVSFDPFRAFGPSDDLTDDVARFVSRANCLAGIEALVYQHHGEHPHRSIAVEVAGSVRVKQRRQMDEEIRRLLSVAWQTELAARLGSAFDEPALLRVMSQTLPVNAYYALFNAHRALSRLEGAPTDQHTSVQEVFAVRRARMLPVPWCATLRGDPWLVEGCVIQPSALVEPYAFNLLERSHEPAAYLWAALRTTRRWRCELARQEWLRARANRKRDGRQRKILPPGQRQLIARKLRETSLLDFLYELRRRASYQTADEYAAEVVDDDVRRFHRGTELLLDTGMLLVETQLASRSSLTQLRQFADGWIRGTRRVGAWAAEPLERRIAAIEQALGA